MRIAVSLVLFHPDLDELRATLLGLVTWEHGPVLVHLNEGSDDDPVFLLVRDLLPAAAFSWSPTNTGFAGGHNTLAAAAFRLGVDAVRIHNPDLVLAADAVAALEEAVAALDGPALLGPALQLAEPGSMQGQGLVDTMGIVWTRSGRHLDSEQGAPWPQVQGPVRRVAGLSGAALLVPEPAYRLLLERTGELFDEEFIAYREDAELAFRAALIGVPSFLVPRATGLHARGSRGTARGRSAHVDRLGVRNRFLIAAKYGRNRPGWLPAVLLRDVVVVAGVLLREQSSLPGLRDAWRLRRVMRAKGRSVLAASVSTSREATGL